MDKKIISILLCLGYYASAHSMQQEQVPTQPNTTSREIFSWLNNTLDRFDMFVQTMIGPETSSESNSSDNSNSNEQFTTLTLTATTYVLQITGGWLTQQ